MRLGLGLLAGLVLLTLGGVETARAQKRYPPSPHIAPTDPRSPADEQKSFHLPPGFEVQLVAAEPDIIHPINIAFDARSRLWVTQSREYPYPAKNPSKTEDTLKVLEDFGPDGRARKITTYADNLNIPIGVLPLSDGALAYSIPGIHRYWDSSGGARAGKRELLYGLYGHADTHGMTGEFVLGCDGWVYACHGFANTSTVKAKDGSQITMRSGNTYRFKIDGSHVEYFTHGQVNPFGLCFDPLGNLYSCDCHTRPIYQLLRGAWYPSFGAPHDGLGYGPEMMTHSHGSTAIAGITYYAADHFPKEFHDNIFVGNVVTNRVNRDTLQRHGSTYLAVEQPDFIVSDDPWYRPVDIKLGPDGALYIADFYNRIIGHYELPLDHPGRDRDHGRIWRVIYRGPDGKGEPRAPRADWIKATVKQLVEDLAHPNLTVRLIATHQLAERDGKDGIEAVRTAMKPSGSKYQRMHGLWVLDRQGVLDDDTLTAAARDPEASVRVYAMRVLVERKELAPRQRDMVLAGLKDVNAFVQRTAAEALGSHPGLANLRPLLDLQSGIPAEDTHLQHAARIALRDQLRPASTWDKLSFTGYSEKDLRALTDVCVGVEGPSAARFLVWHLREVREPRENLLRYMRHVGRYYKKQVESDRDEDVILMMICERLTRDRILQADIARAFHQGLQEAGRKPGPETSLITAAIAASLLTAQDASQVQAGVDLASMLKISQVQEQLVLVLTNKKMPEAPRSGAARALMAINPNKHSAALGHVLADPSAPSALREEVAGSLGGANQSLARKELLTAMGSAPAKLQNAIAAALAGSKEGAETLLETVAAGKASARLLQHATVQQRLGQAGVPNLQDRVAKLTGGLPRVEKRLQALIAQRSAGFARAKADVGLGAKVFEKNCAVCHQIANKGALIAPQLDGVGIRGPERLLEDILDPNRNVDQAFRATTLTLKNGQVVSGLLLREEGKVLVMVDGQGKEQRHADDAVETRIVSQMSPMPADLGEQLSEPDLYNLLAYLLTQRTPAPKGPR